MVIFTHRKNHFSYYGTQLLRQRAKSIRPEMILDIDDLPTTDDTDTATEDPPTSPTTEDPPSPPTTEDSPTPPTTEDPPTPPTTKGILYNIAENKLKEEIAMYKQNALD